MSYWPICVCRCVVQATRIYHRSLVEGSDALRVEITSTGWSSHRFLGGGGDLAKSPSQVPQNWKLREFRPLFFGRSQNSLSKNEERSDLPPAREVPKIIENLTEVDIFDVEEKCAFFMYVSWFWIDYGCVSIQLQEDFGIPKIILKFWT